MPGPPHTLLWKKSCNAVLGTRRLNNAIIGGVPMAESNTPPSATKWLERVLKMFVCVVQTFVACSEHIFRVCSKWSTEKNWMKSCGRRGVLNRVAVEEHVG
jgi:hypothetical protein